MAPTTRSMCLKAKRQPKITRRSNIVVKQADLVVPSRTRLRCSRRAKDQFASCSVEVGNNDKDDIFQADFLPEVVLVHIFSFLTVKEKCRLSCVSHKWNQLVKHPRLWRLVTDSPRGSGELLKFIRTFLGNSLWCFLPKTLTAAGLKLLESRCANLKYLLVNYTHKTQQQHFRHLDLGLYFPVNANGIILRIPLCPVDNKLVGYLVASKNLKRIDWKVIMGFADFEPIVKMVAEVKLAERNGDKLNVSTKDNYLYG